MEYDNVCGTHLMLITVIIIIFNFINNFLAIFFLCNFFFFFSLQEPDTAAITRARRDNPKVIINVGGLKHEVGRDFFYVLLKRFLCSFKKKFHQYFPSDFEI